MISEFWLIFYWNRTKSGATKQVYDDCPLLYIIIKLYWKPIYNRTWNRLGMFCLCFVIEQWKFFLFLFFFLKSPPWGVRRGTDVYLLFVHVLEVKVIGWFSDQSGTAIHVEYSRALYLTASICVLTSMYAGWMWKYCDDHSTHLPGLKMPQCLVWYLQFSKGTCMDWNGW